ncbi:hypothetical protein [Rubellicoccus peritrichatus]|uniref:Ig-like domain-containing protein n=1 Tax=Rubellicoccus peritrichatus TaxID=3080537 RepID=A0AAQ3QVX0_9BACT|nr:hypothetical protein [Puniceicoccus sp. CR14]WOO41340.1 hypothetical protein RZN69_22200 [Puniceicoccus sp. CR14]
MKMKFFALGATLLFAAASAHASSIFGDFASKQTLQYEGTWNNKTFGSSDTYTGTLEIDGRDFTLTTTINGNVYGFGISVPLTFSGTIDEDLVTDLGSNFETYGGVSATIDFTKSPATITATSTPDAESTGIAPSTTEATFDFENLDATFIVNFTIGDPAEGSSNATLVEESPVVVNSPTSMSVTSGSTATIEVEATGSLISFQWYQGESGDTSNGIKEADDYTFTTPALTEEAKYWARITNSAGKSVDTDTVTVSVTAAPTPTSLFVSGSDLGNNFFFSNWIGLIFVGTPPWYYHEAHGFFYTASTDESTVVWIFDLELGWVFTNSDVYPSIYNNDRGAWTFFDVDSAGPRIFFDFNTNTFFTAP